MTAVGDARKRRQEAADQSTQQAPGVGLTEEERAWLGRAWYAATDDCLHPAAPILAAVERIVAARVAEVRRLHHGQPTETCIDADRRAEHAEAERDDLGAAVADKADYYARLGGTAIDEATREYLPAFAATLRALISDPDALLAERDARIWDEAAELADSVIVSWSTVPGLHPTEPEPHPAAIAAAGARRTLVVLRSRMAEQFNARQGGDDA